MSSFNPQQLSQFPYQQVINNHLTVQTAAEITGYNIQYLRRLLRANKLEAIKIGQVWLIDLASLEIYLAQRMKTDDRRCGPRNGLGPNNNRCIQM
ncbi:helix-turn-helix domain-containing protein [Chloroflexota bacterium]